MTINAERMIVLYSEGRVVSIMGVIKLPPGSKLTVKDTTRAITEHLASTPWDVSDIEYDLGSSTVTFMMGNAKPARMSFAWQYVDQITQYVKK